MMALNAYLNSEDKHHAQSAYKALKDELGDGQNVIALARAIRAKVGDTLSTSSKKTEAKRLVLMLQLVNRVFSTSDAHHLVVTPCSLLACNYLMRLVQSGVTVPLPETGTSHCMDIDGLSKGIKEVVTRGGKLLGIHPSKEQQQNIQDHDTWKGCAFQNHSQQLTEVKGTIPLPTINLQSLIFETPDIVTFCQDPSAPPPFPLQSSSKGFADRRIADNQSLLDRPASLPLTDSVSYPK